jgi:hypothetical protein
VYLGTVASFWGIAEAYTYFTGDRLKAFLGDWWFVAFYGLPVIVAALVATRRGPMELSQDDLDILTRDAADPIPTGPIQRPFHNVEISDRELRRRIVERNRDHKPTYLLRMEYARRLAQRQR